MLVKSQLRLSESIITECLNAVMRELRECLQLESVDVDADADADADVETEKYFDVEEFYDVKSGSISSDEDEPDESDTFVIFENEDDSVIVSQLKMIPGLFKSINRQVTELLNSAYKSTRTYLDDYCSMQRELVYCNEAEYIEAFREYYRMRRGGISMLALDEVPVRRIVSESFDELKSDVASVGETDYTTESTGFLKEFMALLFPPLPTTKRVEYRPNSRPSRSRAKPVDPFVIKPAASSSQDESFLLKLLEIYLKSHHRLITDFLPKCLNYHLIGRLRAGLPFKLLKMEVSVVDGADRRQQQVKWIAGIIQLIDEIKG